VKSESGSSAIRVLITSFRLRHTDGVSVEAAKLERIFQRWGWEVAELAGEFGSACGNASPVEVLRAGNDSGSSDIRRYLAPPLSIEYAVDLRKLGLWEGRNTRECLDLLDRHSSAAEESIAAALDDFRPDLVIVENVFGLPLNPGYAEALCKCLDRRSLPALARHHDLIWQRSEFALDRLSDSLASRIEVNFPPRSDDIVHVAINRLSKAQLKDRGFDPLLVYNGFEFPNPLLVLEDSDSSKRRARDELGIPHECVLLVQPTRAIERKGVPDSIDMAQRLAEKLDECVYLLVCGPPEDGYESVLAEIEKRHAHATDHASRKGRFRLVLGMGKLPIDLAYQASDYIVFPSRWEGFGNPVIESIIWGRPIVVREYPVLSELLELGLSVIAWDPDPLEGVCAWMRLDAGTKRAILEDNLVIASSRLSVECEARGIEEALKRLGISANAGDHEFEGAQR
jgi:glycosyltransferase involved in cell wall biosynthesis